ncbi:hypothetical protein OUZ56_022526 [Daphnia magna]|uniref:Uncharacterized protein n=1 Tax=Daphnia magna TaxID=35525 RepID=A0ABR0AWN5_9CRUS|nr:hypothetical protein OUZ56_022526 [Daphnia magna]
MKPIMWKLQNSGIKPIQFSFSSLSPPLKKKEAKKQQKGSRKGRRISISYGIQETVACNCLFCLFLRNRKTAFGLASSPPIPRYPCSKLPVREAVPISISIAPPMSFVIEFRATLGCSWVSSDGNMEKRKIKLAKTQKRKSINLMDDSIRVATIPPLQFYISLAIVHAISCGNVRAELLDVAGVTWECNEARGNNISVSKIAFAVSNFRAYSNSR